MPTPESFELETLIASEPFDPQAAIEAIAIVAGGAEAMMLTARRELERAPWHDADPEAPEGAVGRRAVMARILEVAEGDARSVRTALGLIARRLAAFRVGQQ